MYLVIPAISAAGLLYGAYYIEVASKPPAFPNVQVGLPPTSPFPETISGTGIIEANSRNIDIGSNLSGVVVEVHVTEGQMVKQGDPLFRLDDRSAKANYFEQQNAVASAKAQIEEAKTLAADQKDQLTRAELLKTGVSITVDRLERLRFAAQTATAKLRVAKANLVAAESRWNSAGIELQKLTVNAPIDGRILKANIHPGEYVQAGAKTPPIVLGNDKPLYIRVSIDENDLWRFKEDSAAEGALRSNRAVRFPLHFVRSVPYVIPKTSLTGLNSERVDTRVLEVLYSIGETESPLFIGQQVDVFIAVGDKQEDSR